MALNTQQITGLDALNKKIATGYKVNAVDQANLDYAAKQGYKYNPTPVAPVAPAIPTGATKILNPSGLAGLTESQLFRQGKDIYKLPTTIPSDNLTTNTARNITPIQPEVNTDIQTLMSGVDTSNKGLQAQLEARNKTLQEQTNLTEIQKRQADYSETQKTAQRDLQTQTWNQYGLNTNVAKVQELMPQIEKVTAEFNSLQEQNANLPISSRIIGGTADKLTRQKAIEVAGLSAVAQAYQGNVDMARNIASDAINAQYKDQQTYLENLSSQINNAYTDLTAAEKKRADEINLVIAERERLLTEEKDTKKQISDLAVTAAQNGADTTTVNSILKSTNYGDAIKNSGAFLQTVSSSNWDTFTDSNGEIKLVNKQTGEVKNISSANTNLGNQIGEIMGLPSYDTRAENPGVTRSDRNNNPGNIKVSDNTKNWEGVIGVESSSAADGGNLLIFDSPESGINAIVKLLLTNGYSGMTAEKAIKRYNGNGSYGAATVGLDPNQDFQSQLQDPAKLKSVAALIAQAEGFTGGSKTTTTNAENWAKLITDGKAKITNVPKALQNDVAALVSDTKEMTVAEQNKQSALSLVDELINDPGRESATGISAWKSILPGSKAKTFALKADRLVGLLTLDAIKQMRGLGALSDAEGKRLENSMSILKDRYISEKDYLAELERVKQTLQEASGNISTTQEEYPAGTVVEVGGVKYKSLGDNNFEPIK
jgi:uncharacterized protein (UPF0335 family)